MSGRVSAHGRGWRFGARRVLFVAAALALPFGAFLLGRWIERRGEPREGSTASRETSELWTCGMHPQVIQEEPGTCPLCGMALTPMAPTSGASEAAPGERKIAYWWDPMMSPPYISDRPGKSPMGMDLVPRYEDEVAGGPGVTIHPDVVQNMGIRESPVEAGPLEAAVRTFGRFREAEPLQLDVTLKLGGYVENLHADTVGMEIGEGDPLFELYGPEILVAQEELLAARRALDRIAPAAGEAVRAELAETVETARRRLVLWDFPEEEIARIEALPRADGRVTFRARMRGILVEKNVVLGSSVMAGMRVLRVTDYSTLWLDAQAYEYQIPLLRLGLEGRARVESFPGENFEGSVIFLAPSLEESTRTATVRLAFANPDLRLRPGMYARVELRSLLAERAIQVPREAVLDTGVRQVAFVSRGLGRFEARTVRVGRAGRDGNVEILDGLAPGDTVVVSGQFLLDAESRLREAARKFLEAKRGAAAPEAGGTIALEAPPPLEGSVPGETRRRVDALVQPYLRLVDLLAADGYDVAPVVEIRDAAQALASDPSAEAAAIGERLVEEARALESSPEDGRRKAFAALSETVVRLVETVPPTSAAGGTLFVLRCPMFPGSWLQPSREVTNPLYGKEMLHCGQVVRAIAPAPAPVHEGHGPR